MADSNLFRPFAPKPKKPISTKAILSIIGFLVIVIISVFVVFNANLVPAPTSTQMAGETVSVMPVEYTVTPVPPTPAYTPQPSATLTITASPTITSTPTATPDYIHFKPRKEPDSTNYLFYDEFLSDFHNWNTGQNVKYYGVEVKDNKLETTLSTVYKQDTFLVGCDKNCNVQAPQDTLVSIKINLENILGHNGVLAGIVFGSVQPITETTGFYVMIVNNGGQVRFRHFAIDTDLYNEVAPQFQIPKNKSVIIQLDVYSGSDCPENMEQCGLLFVNDKIAMKTPVPLSYPLNGYLGLYAITKGTSGYTRIIKYNYIKIWSTP